MSNNLTLYENSQRKQTLAFILWSLLIATIALGVLNITFKTWDSIIVLFGMAALCVPLLLLNSRGYTFFSAALLSVLILLVINVNLYDGDGILDSGILSYPIFILIGTLLFGKRAAPIFTAAALTSSMAIVYAEIHGQIHPTLHPAKYSDLIPIGILFLIAATTIWVIIGNMEKNLERVKRSDAEIRETYSLTLEAWAKVLEIHDKETEGHSRRVVELSIRLARALGCTEEQIIHLRHGALLHDIGKIAIPDQILCKPGRLNESEMEIVKKHPEYAKKILDNIPFLQPSVEVAYSHHERWDGQGYPEGLKGEEIPFLARIFTVIDQWDALSADRVYRPAWSRERVIAYFIENKGKILDPNITNVFLQLI
ncbi:MAG: HD-GYP domain-containing protein [Anaerolineales bacterium]|nr:HD-GYP domain-containing protein [Anaerolineales bacterium]